MALLLDSDEEPPTDPPALYTETRGPGTKSKIGWAQFTSADVPAYYLTQGWTQDDYYDLGGGESDTVTGSGEWTAARPSGTISGSSTRTTVSVRTGSGSGSFDSDGEDYIPGGDAATHGDYFPYGFVEGEDNTGMTREPTSVTLYPIEDNGRSGSNVWTLSDPYTTDDLKDDTLASLGDWVPGGDTGSYSLSASEETFAIQQLRYQIKYHPSPTCYTKVWLRFTETPAGEDPVITDTATELPFPSGPICLTDPTKSIADPVNQMETALTEITPTTNGSITVELLKYSYLPDYEPSGMGDSGFPPGA